MGNRISGLGWSVLLALVLLVLAGPVFAADQSPLTSEGSWDWEKGTFTLTLRAPLPTDTEATPPKRRYLAEREAERHIQQEFVRRVGALPVASGKTLAEVMAADPSIEAGVAQLGEKLKFVSSRVDEGYTTLEMVWSVGLWDGLAPVLNDAAEANPVPPLVQWAPSRDFSGIVIFAMGDLPWVGTGLTGRWAPSMAFRLLNPKGEVVFDPSMSDQTFVTKWGQAGTSLGLFNEDRWRDRIGFDPLRIVARGVWGAKPGDLVLAQADWDRILSREANRKLLAEGRVLVLYGPFPDYAHHPNPESAIDEEKPPIENIPEPPAPQGPAKAAPKE
jgi:hypothetical protein